MSDNRAEDSEPCACDSIAGLGGQFAAVLLDKYDLKNQKKQHDLDGKAIGKGS